MKDVFVNTSRTLASENRRRVQGKKTPITFLTTLAKSPVYFVIRSVFDMSGCVMLAWFYVRIIIMFLAILFCFFMRINFFILNVFSLSRILALFNTCNRNVGIAVAGA